MRVLHVYRTYYPDSKGGIQQSIKQITLSTKSKGVESRIFTLSPNPHPEIVNLEEALVCRTRSWIAPASCNIGGLNSFLKFQKLADWADIIHFHFPWPFLDLLHLFSFSKKPTVLTYHSDIVKQRFLNKLYTPLMHYTLSKMSAIVATSPNYMDSSPVLSKYILEDRVKMIPLGISNYKGSNNSEVIENTYLNEIGVKSNNYLLFLGVLRYYKGLQFLINAAQSISGTIIIAGDGPERAKLNKLSNLYNLDNVIFLGEVSDDQKDVLLKHCRAFVLPSHLHSEAFGMVLIEAAMNHKPMICCEIGSGTSYVNAHGITGLVVLPGDSVALSEACNTLLADSKLASKMGEAAFQRYEALFSAEALGQSYTELYSQLLNSRN